MPFNGAGTFNPPAPPVYPPIYDTVISEVYFQALMSDIFTGLSSTLTRDGQSVPVANLPMGGYRLTDLGDGSAAQDAVTVSQLTASIRAGVGAIWVTGADPTGVADSTPAFLSAIAIAKAARYSRVLVPAGMFRLTANMELGRPLYDNTPGGITVGGMGPLATILRSEVTGTTPLFSITGGNLNYYTYAGLQDLTLENATFKSGLGCAVLTESTVGNRLKNVIIRNMRYGVWLYNGLQFGGGGWCEFNEFDHVVTDYCDECWRLEHNPANTAAVPSHGYNKWIHCLGNVYASSGSNPAVPQIFFHIVNDKVNFYNSDFDFYVNTQDGGTLIQANGNGGGPLAPGARVGLVPSNSGNIHVECNSNGRVTGNRNFWWKGLLSYTAANFLDQAGISVNYPGYSVIRCDNYEYSGSNMNVPASIDRFTDSRLAPWYPLQRTGAESPWIAVDDGTKRGVAVYSDGTDGILAGGLRAAAGKLQDIAVKWWTKLSGLEQGNIFGWRLFSNTAALTTVASGVSNFTMVDGAWTVYIKGDAAGSPAYVVNIAKANSTAALVIATAVGSPSNPGGHTLLITWPAGFGPQFATSNAAINGNYKITVTGVSA